MLTLYRAALHLRRRAARARRRARCAGSTWAPDVVAFDRHPGFTCVVNTWADALPLPGGELLLASDPVFDGGELPTDTAAWLRTPLASS